MKQCYLEITYRRGRPLAEYLYLPRRPGDKSVRIAKAEPGMMIDFEETGKAIGIEMTLPTLVTAADINCVLSNFGVSAITGEDVIPLQVA